MKIKKVLEALKKLDQVETPTLFRYSSKAIWQSMYRMEARRAGRRSRGEIIAERKKEEREKFYSILAYLRRQGFISKHKDSERKSIWKITKRGREKLKKLTSKNKKRKLLAIKPKSLAVDDHLKIIVFDIPEKKREYRQWIRQTLRNFDFKLMQQSVWIGKKKLPEEFFGKLKQYNLLSCVHIFSVADKGTLHEK